ncbi:S-methyl-5'-thioadenosine phosphorylase-like [Anthonomus grandis grandis]|uniref:S-methyl-5'-thioadenosine phosphorylase-like n=1 Tax=Anthonomus grandis grandis TaxID=2921223 RepID=UPI0021663B86|nr:S-methyl-5'-thioadenosine phosphorylase-like [Anthonomus grandis grandis]
MSYLKIGIIGGSGLDNPDILKNRSEKRVTTIFGDPSDVLILGEISGVACVLLARHGRKHDKMPGAVNYRANIWALKEEGCTHIIATNACGSLQEDIPPGTLVVADGFIDRTTNRKQTFYDGEPDHPSGVCHMPMEPIFYPKLRQVILQTACEQLSLPIRNGGVILTIEGPRYSSKAESLIFKSWGAHLVGMTTVPEAVLAKEAGIMYAVIAMATDWDCWRDHEDTVTHHAVLEVFQKNVEKVIKLLKAVIPQMTKVDWTNDIKAMQDLVKTSIVSG